MPNGERPTRRSALGIRLRSDFRSFLTRIPPGAGWERLHFINPVKTKRYDDSARAPGRTRFAHPPAGFRFYFLKPRRVMVAW